MIWSPGMQEMVRPNVWTKLLIEKRKEYMKLKEEFLRASPADSAVDPLEIGTESTVWTEYNADERTKKVIKRDIARLYQDIPFFENNDESEEQKEKFQNDNLNHILDIVFVHLKEHPGFEYQQGYMNFAA